MEIRTRADYDGLIEQLSNKVDNYENHYGRNNRYLLFLANGEQISFEFNNACIPHLLGVDTTFLSQYCSRSKTGTTPGSYDTLKYLLDNSYSVYNSLTNNNSAYNSPDKLKNVNKAFSGYVEDKIEFFDKQIAPPYPNSIAFVCKYDTEKNYMTKPVDGIKAGYIIGRTTNDGDLVLLGLVKDERYPDGNHYWAQTSRTIRNDGRFNEKLNDILHNQEITYATGLITENRFNEFNKNVPLNSIETSNALNVLQSYASVTGAIPNTIAGHIYNLSTLSKEKSKSYVPYKLLDDIDARKIIDLEEDEKKALNPVVLRLINEHNDYVVATGNIDSLTSGTFSEIKDERDALRKELEQIKKMLEDATESNKVLEEANKEQASKLNAYDEIADRFINASEELKRIRTRED